VRETITKQTSFQHHQNKVDFSGAIQFGRQWLYLFIADALSSLNKL
jgi:hypothetical protein